MTWWWGLLWNRCWSALEPSSNGAGPVALGLLLELARCVPVSAVVPVLVELAATQVPAGNQLRESPLDRFGADGHAVLSLKLLLHLAGLEPCVGHAVAKLTATAATNNLEPAPYNAEAQRSDRAKCRCFLSGHER